MILVICNDLMYFLRLNTMYFFAKLYKFTRFFVFEKVRSFDIVIHNESIERCFIEMSLLKH